MKVGMAAHNTLCQWKANCGFANEFPKAKQSDSGWGLPHARFLLETILNEEEEWKNDKLNRWLGYAQAILVATRMLSLEECKRANRQA